MLSELVDEAIKVLSTAAQKKLQSQSRCLLQIILSCEVPVYVLPVATANTFKDTVAVKAHHWYVQ